MGEGEGSYHGQSGPPVCEESQAERLDVRVDLVLVRHMAKRIENLSDVEAWGQGGGWCSDL